MTPIIQNVQEKMFSFLKFCFRVIVYSFTTFPKHWGKQKSKQPICLKFMNPCAGNQLCFVKILPIQIFKMLKSHTSAISVNSTIMITLSKPAVLW